MQRSAFVTSRNQHYRRDVRVRIAHLQQNVLWWEEKVPSELGVILLEVPQISQAVPYQRKQLQPYRWRNWFKLWSAELWRQYKWRTSRCTSLNDKRRFGSLTTRRVKVGYCLLPSVFRKAWQTFLPDQAQKHFRNKPKLMFKANWKTKIVAQSCNDESWNLNP